MDDLFSFTEGQSPLLVSLPHDGTGIPAEIAARMTSVALATPDTDWHVGRLYDFAAELGASVIAATPSRYVIDLNRAPDGAALYSTASNTELVPLTSFDMEPLYRQGMAPDAAEISVRKDRFWSPYHRKLRNELNRLRRTHGVAILFEGHSIRSVVPRFFDGTIPDLNLGSAGGESCALALATRAFEILNRSPYDAVWDERFTGGYITRKFGRPTENIHALQLELTWKNYMEEEPPYRYLPDRAERLKATLRPLLEAILGWAAHNSNDRVQV
jgi:N-formylglutamate deformylase